MQRQQITTDACALSCVQFCSPVESSPPVSPAHGIFQARILEWSAIFYSRESSWPRGQTWVSWVSSISQQVLCRECHLGKPPMCGLFIYCLDELCFHSESVESGHRRVLLSILPYMWVSSMPLFLQIKYTLKVRITLNVVV